MAPSPLRRLRRIAEAIRRNAEKDEVEKPIDEGWLKLPAERLAPVQLIRSAEVVEER